jgi:hypothetical protein
MPESRKEKEKGGGQGERGNVALVVTEKDITGSKICASRF